MRRVPRGGKGVTGPAQGTRIGPRLAALVLLAFSSAGPAAAPSLPSTPLAKEVAPSAAGASSAPSAPKASLRERLAQAQAELAASATPETLGASAPVGAAEQELISRRAQLAMLVGLYQLQVDREADLAELKARRTALEVDEDQGVPPLAGPPFSYLAVDQVRDLARSLRAGVQTYDAAELALARESERIQARIDQAEKGVRQLTEALERAGTGGHGARLERERAGVQLGARVDGATLASMEQERRLTQERKAYDLIRLARVEAALKQTAGNVRFSREELDRVRGALDAEKVRAEGELEQASRRLVAARAELADTQGSVAASRQTAGPAPAAGHPAAAPEGGTAVDPGTADRGAALARALAENAEQAVRHHLLRKARIDRDAETWQQRWTLANSTAPGALAEAQSALADAKAKLEELRAYLTRLREAVRDRVAEEDALLGGVFSPLESQHHQQMQQVFRERGELFDRMLQEISARGQMLERWEQEVDERAGRRSAYEMVRDGAAAGAELLSEVWRFELVTVEDSIEVEGETITGRRSITVGKVVKALFILVLGYWLTLWLARRLERVAVARFRLDAGRALIARRWLEAAGFVVLVVVALNWVKIPLAVFAFLGGAVAIGAGFGMQTMVKNLISGLMILFERPFRLGDLVEVGAIRGRVTEIGVRASVVRDSKGVETLVPNSTFVEQNVTNWTYTSPRVRFSVAVAVAYGSPTRRVTEILAEVAGRHPLVLPSPGPVAVLEDFGADAMSFVVDFWVEVRPGVEPRLVASELRHQIVEALGAAGIVMPSAQREVQLDTVRPLAVQVVPAAGMPG